MFQEEWQGRHRIEPQEQGCLLGGCQQQSQGRKLGRQLRQGIQRRRRS